MTKQMTRVVRLASDVVLLWTLKEANDVRRLKAYNRLMYHFNKQIEMMASLEAHKGTADDEVVCLGEDTSVK